MNSPLSSSLLLSILIGALGATGCSYTEGGTGSKTLQIKAALTYTAGDTDDNSHFLVEVLDPAGRPVPEAIVTIRDGDTEEEFTLSELESGESGVYGLSLPRYRRRIFLSVVRGSDHLEGQLEGPGPHTIEDPPHAGTVKRRDLDKNLKVTWKTADGLKADQITIGLDDEGFSTTELNDRGYGTIPKDELHSGSEGVTVLRRNALIFDSGLNNSSLEITYKVRHGFQVQD